MAGSRGFFLRFALVALTVPIVLGALAYTFYNDIRTKSLYYRLDGSELLTILEGSDLLWTGDSLELSLPSQDIELRSIDFNKEPQQARYQLIQAGQVREDLPLDSLPELTQRWLKRLPELGLREMRTPYEGWLAFRIGKEDWLFYSASGSDLPAEIANRSKRDFDGHWIAVELQEAKF